MLITSLTHSFTIQFSNSNNGWDDHWSTSDPFPIDGYAFLPGWFQRSSEIDKKWLRKCQTLTCREGARTVIGPIHSFLARGWTSGERIAKVSSIPPPWKCTHIDGCIVNHIIEVLEAVHWWWLQDLCRTLFWSMLFPLACEKKVFVFSNAKTSLTHSPTILKNTVIALFLSCLDSHCCCYSIPHGWCLNLSWSMLTPY